MMDMKNSEDEWPHDDRPYLGGTGQRSWLHSDIKDVALINTYPVWKKMIALGGLKE